MSEDPIESMLSKLHRFSVDLDPQERALLGALLAPGVDWALGQASDDDDEVTTFGMVVWTPHSLADGLRRALAERDRANAGEDGSSAL